MKLRDRIALISDADSGSGRAIARKLASEGAALVLNSATAGRDIEKDLEEYAQSGYRVQVVSSQMNSREAVEDVFANAAKTLGSVDLMVHNHQLVRPVSVENCDEQTYQELMDVNVKTAFLCTQACGKYMSAKGSGSIVYVSSIHDEKPTGGSFVYSVAKGAVKMLSREAALYLGRFGIRVNLIEMGPVAGDDQQFASELSDLYLDYMRKIPSAQLGTYEDLANLVWFLSIEESRFVNGADIRLDGGFVLHYMDHKMKSSQAT